MKYQFSSDARMQFTNPYNFISTNFSIDTKKTKAQKGTLSGVIECSLFTRTPLAIPGENINEDPKKHHKYKFMRCGDKLMIPGSSLRGVIRTMYETVTDSCYVTTDPKKVITIRSNAPYQAGLLMKEDGSDKWKLYQADRYLVKVNEKSDGSKNNEKSRESLLNIGFGSKVYFKKYKTENKKQLAGDIRKSDQCEKEADEDEGYLYIGEFFSNKHFESIFKKGEEIENTSESIINDALERLGKTVEMYRNEKINRSYKYKEGASSQDKHTGYEQYENAKDHLGVIPVWYDISETGNLYLSMACIGRMAYKNRMGDLLNQKVACHSKTKLCKACALFGFVGKESEEDRKDAIGSRIRVTDAFLAEGQTDAIMGFYRLCELSSPKESYMPFYLKNETEEEKEWSYDADGVTLRGRKFYWHWDYETYKRNHSDMTYIPYECETEQKRRIEETDRNATMQLVRPEKEFLFKIYFDQITQQQLEELLWTISLGENDSQSKKCYKIGHGKPLGLGSAKIVINKVWQRTFDSNLNYQEQERQIEIKDINMNDDIKRAWEKIVEMGTVQEKEVRYPYVVGVENADPNDNAYAAHQWFGYNFQLGNKKDPKEPLQDISKDQQISYLRPVEKI